MKAEVSPVDALLERASRIARRVNHSSIEPEHLLLAALEPPSEGITRSLRAMRLELATLRAVLQAEIRQETNESEAIDPVPHPELVENLGPFPHADNDSIVRRLILLPRVALSLRSNAIDVDHFVALLSSEESALDEDESPMLSRFCLDVTRRAQAGLLDPVIGRETELRLLVQVLGRRFKNNPLLVGEPGVGKSALIEGLAERILAKEVPSYLEKFRVLTLDLGQLLAGTKFRGEFEERLQGVLSEIREQGNILLFIDEIHMLMGAGAGAGGADAANLIKPALARGELHCIGATTSREYRLSIEKDGALSRRFQTILLEEPTEAQALQMLRALRPRMEAHHEVRISDAALVEAIRLGVRYVSERRLPDKAIDLVDQAGAKLRSESAAKPVELVELSARCRELETSQESDAAGEFDILQQKLKVLTAQWLTKRAAINEVRSLSAEIAQVEAAIIGATKERRFEVLAKLSHQRLPSLKERRETVLEGAGEILRAEPLSGSDIAKVVEDLTQIPVDRLQEQEGRRLEQLESMLAVRVVAQGHAVSAVSKAIRRSRAHLRDPQKPVASFLFVGPTGVGKTELSKAVTEFLFDDPKALVRFDMSEYQEQHSLARLIGAPPGYVGHDSGGELTNTIRRKPFSVVLFDEVEKAHPEIFNVLLQVLDEGHLMDGSGVRVDFKNTLIMLTSNLGTSQLRGGESTDEVRRLCEEAAQQFFRPEFINRLDDVIVFNSLAPSDLEPIAQLQLDLLRGRLEAQGVSLEVEAGVVGRIAQLGHDPRRGARPLQRLVREQISDPIADILVSGEMSEGGSVRVHDDLSVSVVTTHA